MVVVGVDRKLWFSGITYLNNPYPGYYSRRTATGILEAQHPEEFLSRSYKRTNIYHRWFATQSWLLRSIPLLFQDPINACIC